MIQTSQAFAPGTAELVARALLRLRDLGGKGSGNFGHSGRPGEVGGSGAAAGFVKPTPEQRKALGLPPAWTDVLINPNPKADLLAVGKDVKGRTQYRYSAAHSEAAAAEKFTRMRDFDRALPALRAQVKQDLASPDPTVRESAAVVALIDKTGFRIGSEQDTGADKQAYGATTLEVRHVKIDGDEVSFKFVGKKGVDITKSLVDRDLARTLKQQIEGKAKRDQLFSVSDHDIRNYMNERAPDFSPKDFRTRHATAMALDLVKNMPVPKTQKDFKAARNEVGNHVSEFLGNTRTVALASYIDPTVFSKWKLPK